MSTAKQIRLWDDGTWTGGGGHWIAVRIEEWQEILCIVAPARGQRRKPKELARRIERHDRNVARATQQMDSKP